MKIGVPTETKPLEHRVALVPAACADLVADGHRLLLQSGAGEATGFSDERYREQGVEIVADADALFAEADLVVKVKEPIGPELGRLRAGQLLFSYLHLAADADLTRRLLGSGVTAIAFETVDEGGELPLLAPMSDIAGRIAVQVGAHLLHQPQGGSGLLLGGLPGAPRGRVVVIGGGVAGGNAARLAAALGAQVTVFDRRRDRMAAMRDLGPNVEGLYPFRSDLDAAVRDADLLIGAVLIPGDRAPKLVARGQIEAMRPGSAVVDIAIDQGGCIETSRPTDYRQPTYQHAGVTHFCVTNMPGAVPRSASWALSAALLPYVRMLAAGDWGDREALCRGVNVRDGELVHPVLRKLYPDLGSG